MAAALVLNGLGIVSRACGKLIKCFIALDSKLEVMACHSESLGPARRSRWNYV